MKTKIIRHKILIESLIRDEINKNCEGIQVYCFSGRAKIIYRLYGNNSQTIYNSDLNFTEDIFCATEKMILNQADKLIKQSVILSETLSKGFQFVRLDWTIYQRKLFFEEMTFTPYSGFHKFKNKETALNYGNLLDLKGIE